MKPSSKLLALPSALAPGLRAALPAGLLAALLAPLLLAGACVRVRLVEQPPSSPQAAATATPAPTLTDTPQPTPSPTASPTPVPTGTPSPPATPTATREATPTPPRRALPQWAAGLWGWLYFLREGDLWRLEVESGAEVELLAGVEDFDVDGDGRIAFVRGGQLWLAISGVETALSGDLEGRAARPRWSPRGQVAWTQSSSAYEPSWMGWGRWCAGGRVYLQLLGSDRVEVGPGCDPAWAPEGLRLAFTTAPRFQEDYPPASGNAIHLVNREGQNQWQPVGVGADVPPQLPPHARGYVLYGPVWAPDGRGFHYFRFLGMAIETDFSSLEVSSATDGGARLEWVSGPWAARAATSDGLVAYDMGGPNAAGFEGFLAWRVEVVDTTQETTLAEYVPILDNFPPEEKSVTVGGRLLLRLSPGMSPAFSPDGSVLAYLRPPRGRAEQPPDDYAGPAEVWLRELGSENAVRLVGEVDFGSPLVWRSNR